MSGIALRVLLALAFLLEPSRLQADQFPIFDGRTYNGKFYPRVDIIEWSDTPGQPTYMDFHVYSKTEPLNLTFKLDAQTGKVVMLVNYFFPNRPEHQCRRVLAPQHFRDGFFVYTDNSDPDYNSIVISMYKMPDKKGRQLLNSPPAYAACSDDTPERDLASSNAPGGAGAKAAPSTGQGSGASDQVRPKSDPGALKGKGDAVPFGNW